MSEWKKVVFASDCRPCEECGEPVCEVCQVHYAECDCPGPTQDDEYEYKEVKHVLMARLIPEVDKDCVNYRRMQERKLDS